MFGGAEVIATNLSDQIPGSDISSKLSKIQQDLKSAYLENHHPWIVAYSGGKDSTLLLQLVCELLLSLPKAKSRKDIHIISNDTLVESPLVIKHLDKNLALLKQFRDKHKLPIHIKKTTPNLASSFWVNLIGKGYIPPTRHFRWCTPKMKIAPTSDYIKKFIGKDENVILLLGVRKSESLSRRRSIEKHASRNGSRYNPHDTLKGCQIYSPIVDIDEEEVWHILMQRLSAWGSSHRALFTLYRNAKGGECPTILSEDDTPSCGSTSPRFGCWTCTVVRKDRSLKGLIDSGFDEFEPLLDFRDKLIEWRDDNKNRMPVRRDGRVKFHHSGSRIYGPFKLEVREKILEDLLKLEKSVGMPLINKTELFLIKRIWETDKITQNGY